MGKGFRYVINYEDITPHNIYYYYVLRIMELTFCVAIESVNDIPFSF